jgi:hypothetical protein
MNEESGEGLMSKITDSWDKEVLGHIKIPLPHIPHLHTTSPLFATGMQGNGLLMHPS